MRNGGPLRPPAAVRKLLPVRKEGLSRCCKTQAREGFHRGSYLNIRAFGGFLASGLDLLLVGFVLYSTENWSQADLQWWAPGIKQAAWRLLCFSAASLDRTRCPSFVDSPDGADDS